MGDMTTGLHWNHSLRLASPYREQQIIGGNGLRKPDEVLDEEADTPIPLARKDHKQSKMQCGNRNQTHHNHFPVLVYRALFVGTTPL
jgi:hypothetical protein